MKSSLKRAEINGETQLLAILGHPVSHSLSPLLHNSALGLYGINMVYTPLDLQKPSISFKKSLLALENFRGCSVTIPHKKWAYRTADECDDLTRCCQAANTLIKNEQGKLLAYNTDGPGALDALHKSGVKTEGKSVMIIGYGGSAAAIAHTLLLKEELSALYICGRNPGRVSSFLRALKKKHPGHATPIHLADPERLSPDAVDIIIQTTPLGMKNYKSELPLPKTFIQKRHTVFDIVYTPLNTPIIKLARQRGAKTVPGYLMLLYQATRQFKLFTGRNAPVELMEKKLINALYKK